MNELIPRDLPPALIAVFLVLPFVSLYALWRIHQYTGGQWLRWNRVAPLPFSIFEIITIMALVGLAKESALGVLLPFLTFACATWFTQKHGLSLSVQWGLDRTRIPALLRCALNGYVAVLLPMFVATAFSFFVCEKLGYTDLLQDSVKAFEKGDRAQMIRILVLATLFAPLWEEMFFRGIIYPWLKFKIPRIAALFLSALFFAAIHNHLPSFLPLAVLGLALALAYEYSGSLIPSMLLHGLFNFATCLNLLLTRPS